MKRVLWVALLITSLLIGFAPAQGARELPFITGGGRATNNNTGNTENPDQEGFGGFVARATDGPDADGVYPAEGEVQARSADGNETIVKVHGDVVCIANRGNDGDQGGDPEEDIWEIRFQIERADFPLPDFPVYSSIVVQDNGREDFIDESADQATNRDCGVIDNYRLEDLRGQITVHD